MLTGPRGAPTTPLFLYPEYHGNESFVNPIFGSGEICPGGSGKKVQKTPKKVLTLFEGCGNIRLALNDNGSAAAE